MGQKSTSSLLQAYQALAGVSAPLLQGLLRRRAGRGKEDPARLAERQGIAGRGRPDGALLWVHAASVGEAQSALILIAHLLQASPQAHILVTSGTVTSAALMQGRLPPRAFHQFYPLDHPAWVARFLDHWRPDLILWMESEIWPNMLSAIRDRRIPAALVNARLSSASFGKWMMVRPLARAVLSCFSLILCQTQKDAERFTLLGAAPVLVTGNLKYSARPLPADKTELQRLQMQLGTRPVWVYASSHAGEEALACRVHQQLKAALPDLLTILVPRHPHRRGDIMTICQSFQLSCLLRSTEKAPPEDDTDIYIVDTMGELGLFYRLSAAACIGRSFSDDGGGGHNPIEAAQLHCAVLYGPHVQFQQEIYDEMREAGAAQNLRNEAELGSTLYLLFTNPQELKDLQDRAHDFAKSRESVIHDVMAALDPLLQDALPGGFAEMKERA